MAEKHQEIEYALNAISKIADDAQELARTEKINVQIAKYNGLIAAIEGDKANYLHKVKKAKALISVALCRQFVKDLNQLIQEDEKD